MKQPIICGHSSSITPNGSAHFNVMGPMSGVLSTWTTTEATRTLVFPAGTISGLWVEETNGDVTDAIYTFAVRVNGASSALGLTIGVGQSSNSVDTEIAVSDGDLVCLQGSAPSGAGGLFWCWGATFTPTTGKRCYIMGGPNGTIATTTLAVRYEGIIPAGTWASAVNFQRETYSPINATLKSIRMVLTVAPGAGASRTFVLYKNGVTTGISIAIADTATVGTATGLSTDVAPTDDFYWECTNSATTPASARAKWYLELQPDINGESPMFCMGNVWDPIFYPGLWGTTPTASNTSGDVDEPAYDQLTNGTFIIKNFYGLAETAPGGAEEFEIGFQKNSDGLLNVSGTFVGAGTTYSNTTNTLSLEPGDRIRMSGLGTSDVSGMTYANLSWVMMDPSVPGITRAFTTHTPMGTATAMQASSTNNPVIVDTVVQGNDEYSFQLDPVDGDDDAYLRVTSRDASGITDSINATVVYIQGWFRYNTLPQVYSTFASVHYDNNIDETSLVSGLKILPTGIIKFVSLADIAEPDSGATNTTTVPIVANTWYRARWYLNNDNGDYSFQIYNESATLIDEFSGNAPDNIATTIYALGLSWVADAWIFNQDPLVLPTMELYYGSWLVHIQSFPPATARVGILLPTGNSKVDTGWTASSGQKWECVDQLPPGVSADRISETATTTAYSAVMQTCAVAGITGDTLAFSPFYLGYEGGAGTNLIAPRVRYDGVAYDAVTAQPGIAQTFHLRGLLYVEMPDATPITTTELDTIQVGAVTGATVDNGLFVQTLGAHVIYDPGEPEPSGGGGRNTVRSSANQWLRIMIGVG